MRSFPVHRPPPFCTRTSPPAVLQYQAKLTVYLDKEKAKLDALVGKVQAAAERLQEYRIALITAAVTGKIKVTETLLEQ